MGQWPLELLLRLLRLVLRPRLLRLVLMLQRAGKLGLLGATRGCCRKDARGAKRARHGTGCAGRRVQQVRQGVLQGVGLLLLGLLLRLPGTSCSGCSWHSGLGMLLQLLGCGQGARPRRRP